MAKLVDLPLGDDVPKNIKELVEAIKFFVPDAESEDEAEVYERAQKGRCMTCEAELGETTMLAINTAGVILIFCGGACYQDMQVVHWLIEQHSDVVDRVKFRGGQGDEPESP